MSADDLFDDVTRAAAEGVSRRQIMRMLAGGIGGGTLLTFGARRAYGAGNPCVERCRPFTGRARGECMQTCNRCVAKGGHLCQGGTTPEGGTGLVCCESSGDCCAGPDGAICCSEGTHCCISRSFQLSCCPDTTECCGGSCCPTGKCCETGLPFGVVCCGPDEECCFDESLVPPQSRCGTADAATGNCVA